MGRAQPAGAMPAVEWEYDRVTLPRDFSRTAVTQILADRAERGGWVLHRLRLTTDGTRRVVLRRKIIRQRVSLA